MIRSIIADLLVDERIISPKEVRNAAFPASMMLKSDSPLTVRASGVQFTDEIGCVADRKKMPIE